MESIRKGIRAGVLIGLLPGAMTGASFAAGSGDGAAGGPLARRASWIVPAPGDVEQRLVQWLDSLPVDAAGRHQALARWASPDPAADSDDVLYRIVSAIAQVEARAAPCAQRLCEPTGGGDDLDLSWLDSADVSPFVRCNLRLAYGRQLAQQERFDEARSQLAGLAPEQVVDPPSLLFYQGLVEHQLLERDSSIEHFRRLTEREGEIPRRYAVLAKAMEADLRGLETGSLDHVSRQMADVRRRLSLGQGGPTVRRVEDDVIAALDKLIEEAEAQNQQQMQAGASSSGGNRSSRPAEDSLPLEGKGEGNVAKRDIGSSDGWGSLDPRQREEVLQQIGKVFPSHFREIIQEYFRKLAETREAP